MGECIDETELPSSWDEMSKLEQDNCLNLVALDFLHEHCRSDAWIEEEEEED